MWRPQHGQASPHPRPRARSKEPEAHLQQLLEAVDRVGDFLGPPLLRLVVFCSINDPGMGREPR